jgi:putative transcription factor
MRCEICGEVIEGQPIKTKIDGSVMDVCQNCSKFGKIQKSPPKPKVPIKSKGKPKQQEKVVPRRIPRDDEPTEEIVEDYNVIVREKRELQGLSREKLAEQINEKASVVGRVEAGKMEPDIKLARKFEKALNITLIESIGEFDLDQLKSSGNRGPTLGDIVKIKKK